MNRISLNTVAREAGVSKTTASLVLNGKGEHYHIARATIEHVQRIAMSLNYRPNKVILNSFGGHSMVIGLVAHNFNTARNSEWLHHLIPEARIHNYQIIADTCNNDGSNLNELIQKFSNIGADGMIVLSIENASSTTGSGQEQGLPIVFADKQPQNPEALSVTDDHASGIIKLIEQLYRQNKRAIGYLGHKANGIENIAKKEAFLENYCQRFDIPPNIELIPNSHLNPEKIAQGCFSLLNKGANSILFEEPELAIPAFSNPTFREAVQKGLICACYGYHPGLQILSQELISIQSNVPQMAKHALEILIQSIQKEPIICGSVKVLPCF
jgi:DNA-binding LacI/PurR family transcriptional regulator